MELDPEQSAGRKVTKMWQLFCFSIFFLNDIEEFFQLYKEALSSLGWTSTVCICACVLYAYFSWWCFCYGTPRAMFDVYC